jgi:hypothetical protein
MSLLWKNIGLWWRYGISRDCDEWKYIIIGRIFESEIILTPITRIIQSLYYAPAGRYINSDSADRGRSIIQVKVLRERSGLTRGLPIELEVYTCEAGNVTLYKCISCAGRPYHFNQTLRTANKFENGDNRWACFEKYWSLMKVRNQPTLRRMKIYISEIKPEVALCTSHYFVSTRFNI